MPKQGSVVGYERNMTKKILVPIDINDPQGKINDFLFPDPTDKKMVLKGINTGKVWGFGMVILTSEISENDLFKRIIDSGNKIESVQSLLNALKEYVIEMPKYKIGNILKLNDNKSNVDFVIEYQRLTKK